MEDILYAVPLSVWNNTAADCRCTLEDGTRWLQRSDGEFDRVVLVGADGRTIKHNSGLRQRNRRRRSA